MLASLSSILWGLGSFLGLPGCGRWEWDSGGRPTGLWAGTGCVLLLKEVEDPSSDEILSLSCGAADRRPADGSKVLLKYLRGLPRFLPVDVIEEFN